MSWIKETRNNFQEPEYYYAIKYGEIFKHLWKLQTYQAFLFYTDEISSPSAAVIRPHNLHVSH